MLNISAVLITKNAESTINLTLNSLKEFPEVIILDTGSTDRTIEICQRFENVEVYSTGFSGFGEAKNSAADLAKNEWILSIDADEVLSAKLLKSIQEEVLDEFTVYRWKRVNYYREKKIKFSGWGKEHVTRLYNRKNTSFNSKLVHESLNTESLKVKTLKGDLLHYSYLSISDFVTKRNLYSELFAIQYRGKRKSSPFLATVKSVFTFFNTFFVQLACFDGYRGLLIATSNAHVTFMKYLKLFEANLGYDIRINEQVSINKGAIKNKAIYKQQIKEQSELLEDNLKILKGSEAIKQIVAILN